MTRPTPDRYGLALGAILLASLAQRAWYAASVLGTQLASVPYLDTAVYDGWARDLVAGDWGRGEPYWMGPLYPHLLALFYAVFGVGGSAILVAQWGLTLVNVLLVHAIARRWLERPWALVATALYALYGPPVFYAGLKLMTTVTTTLLLLIAWQGQRALDRPAPRRWVVLGVLVGIAALARGNVLLLLVLLPWVLWRHDTVTRRRAGRLVAAMWLGAVAVIAPVTLRNVVVGGDLVLVTSNLGLNLYIGQQEEHGGRFGLLDEALQFEFDPTGESMLEAELGRDLRPSEISRELTRRAVARLVDEPGAMLAHYARKAYRFWSGYELPQIYSWTFWRERHAALQALPLAAVWLLATGLIGGWLLPTAARRAWLVLVGGWFLSLLPFFPTSRYRQPIMGLMAIAAAAWLAAVVASWRSGRRRRTAALVVVAGALAVVLWPGWSRFDPAVEAWQSHLNRASRATSANDRATLLAAVAAAEERRPGLAETPYRQGGYLEKLGDREAALASYLEAARRAPRDPFPAYRVGNVLDELGRHREALVWFERAATADPDWALPHHGRGLALRAEGEPGAALAALRRAVALAPGRPRYRSNLASLLAEMGRGEESLAILRELTGDFPRYAPGWFNLAVAELRAGRTTAARRALERAAALPDLTASQRDQIAALQARLR
ncbi:tetratricopeptide repeat protein [bacterium]|nr:tetratricopeptide repeat protein [bacterium]